MFYERGSSLRKGINFMITIKPFRAWRPDEKLVSEVADLPYDVVTNEEVKERLKKHPYSFLKVDKPEAWCEERNKEDIADAADCALQELMDKHILIQEECESLYIYGLESQWGKQYGIVGCFSCQEYVEGKIKKHEKTRADKEADRIRHVASCMAHTGPIFLTCKEEEALQGWIKAYCKTHQVLYKFEDEYGIRQVAYNISDKKDIEVLKGLFANLEALYVADGHHRLQAASTYAISRRKEEEQSGRNGNQAQEEYAYFLGVVFPKSELSILDYNRILKDESGLNKEELIKRLEVNFKITKIDEAYFKPETPHVFGMGYKKCWYALSIRDEVLAHYKKDVVGALDTSLLQKLVLEPIFHIQDPRIDKRIAFVGGIKGLDVLNTLTEEEWDIAFTLYPTSIEELLAVADANELMPPKSTWFEPKLRSGLFIHCF